MGEKKKTGDPLKALYSFKKRGGGNLRTRKIKKERETETSKDLGEEEV